MQTRATGAASLFDVDGRRYVVDAQLARDKAYAQTFAKMRVRRAAA